MIPAERTGHEERAVHGEGIGGGTPREPEIDPAYRKGEIPTHRAHFSLVVAPGYI